MTTVLSWDADRSQILCQIERTRSTLKIVLKTKNDRHFLSDWIEYYSKMAGVNSIIVFDNDSDDAEVFRIYDAYPELLVVRFSGFYNEIHSPEKFPELYRALKISSTMYAFLDTDEFLVLVEDLKVIPPLEAMTKLASANPRDFIPAVWVSNKLLQRDVFDLGSDLATLSHGLVWGKPILSGKSQIPFKGQWNHNCELVQAGGLPTYFGGLFVLHMSNLFPQQRIAINREKLISRGFIDRSSSIQDIIIKDLSKATPHERFYVNEIRYFVKQESLSSENNDFMTPGNLRIIENGALCGSPETLEMVGDFISRFRQHATNILYP